MRNRWENKKRDIYKKKPSDLQPTGEVGCSWMNNIAENHFCDYGET